MGPSQEGSKYSFFKVLEEMMRISSVEVVRATAKGGLGQAANSLTG